MGESKKILIVSRFFYPENTPRSFRTTELAKELHRQGHRVVVYIPNVSDRPQKELEAFGFEIKDLGALTWKDIVLTGRFRFVKRMMKRLVNLFLQYPEIELMYKVRNALQGERGYDLLISIAMPHTVHWGTALAWKENDPIASTWIADCGDPFMGQENDTFRPPFYFAIMEKGFCRKADFITVPIEGAIEAYYQEFHHKIKVIPQGFDFDAIQFLTEYRPNPIPVFGYAGMFIPGKRDPREFLLYLQSIELPFEFHIYTKSPQVVKSVIQPDEKRIILHSPVSRQEVLQHLATMDFVINFENAGGRQLPSKLIDYAIIKRPVLNLKTGDLDDVTIHQFLQSDYRGQMVLGNMEQFKIQNVSRQFLQLMQHEV